MTIAELRETGKPRHERYEAVFTDGTRLRVTRNDIADFSLYAGRELDAETLSALRDASALSGTKERALRILNARAMSERGLYDRLVEKGETEENAAAAVAWLVELHFLNDETYAAELVRHCAAKGYGLRRAQELLYRHKVPRELWETALEALPEQDETLDRLLRAKLRGAPAEDRGALQRATGALLRRGFSWEEIREAVARYGYDNGEAFDTDTEAN